MPAEPKENLPTELVQSRTYAVALERKLAYVGDRFPVLAKEVESANSMWNASPFYAAARSIEKGIVDVQGDKGRQSMLELDALTWNESAKVLKDMTVIDAREFLAQVEEQAKGDIDVDMVRGQLLSHYKPFLENPEKEMPQGYLKPIVHTNERGPRVEFDIPMSWKQGKMANSEVMVFRSNYGYGDLWMTVSVLLSIKSFVDPIPWGKRRRTGASPRTSFVRTTRSLAWASS